MRARRGRGFTLIELLVVLVLIAVSSAVVTLSLRDSASSQLEREGERLAALLEMARAEARASGVAVRWVPVSPDEQRPGLGAADPGQEAQFRFVGLPGRQALPSRWMDGDVRAQVVGGTSVLLGPDAILPPQRVVLTLNERRLELATDGLAPFQAVVPAEATP